MSAIHSAARAATSPCSIIALTLLMAASAQAQMVPVSRFSRVYAWEHFISMGGQDGGTITSEHTSADFLPFDFQRSAGGYTALQQSIIGPSAVSITAQAFGTPQSTFGFGGAESSLVFVFAIFTSGTFQLEGTVASMIGDGFVSLQGPGVDLLANTPGTQPTPFFFSGMMVPGRYEFTVRTTADYGSVTALLTVIPTPGAAALLGLGGMAAARRRR